MKRYWCWWLLLLMVMVSKGVNVVKAATGGAGATGEVLYVSGERGVVGWAQGSGGSAIAVDVYVVKRGEAVGKFICSQGTLSANQTLVDDQKRIGNYNGKVWVYQDSCLTGLADGDYQIYVALGPNFFSTDVFDFSIKTIEVAGNKRWWLHYLGKMIDRIPNNYDSYPTVMREGDVFKMWYASGNNGDSIYYATSNNGINWTTVTGLLSGGAVVDPTRNNCSCSDSGSGGNCPAGASFNSDDMHVADPSVVKVNGTYYMYYTGASKKWSCFGTNNQAFLATSNDGINWTKYTDTTGKVLPVISPFQPCTSASNCGYGAGQSSVVFKDGVWQHFFTDTTNQTSMFSLARSNDGKKFTTIKYGITGYNTWDVKYSNNWGSYLGLVAIPVGVRQGEFKMATSIDGLTWSQIGGIGMTSLSNDSNHYTVHNAGLLGNPEGIIEGDHTVIYSGAGWGMQDAGGAATNSWDIVGVDVWLSKTAEKVVIKGDVNGDGKVDLSDYLGWYTEFTTNKTANLQADFNGDGRTDLSDYLVWYSEFTK